MRSLLIIYLLCAQYESNKESCKFFDRTLTQSAFGLAKRQPTCKYNLIAHTNVVYCFYSLCSLVENYVIKYRSRNGLRCF